MKAEICGAPSSNPGARKAPDACGPTIGVTSDFFFFMCQFDVECSQCKTQLHGRGAITNYGTERTHKKHAKHYCVPCALKVRIIKMVDHRTGSTEVMPGESI